MAVSDTQRKQKEVIHLRKFASDCDTEANALDADTPDALVDIADIQRVSAEMAVRAADANALANYYEAQANAVDGQGTTPSPTPTPTPSPTPTPAPTITVSSVSNASAAEGAAVVHTVTLSGTTTAATVFTFGLSSGTATGSGVDYLSATATFSNGVTLTSGGISVPAGVASFTVSVATVTDTLAEGNETYGIQVGGVTATGTITNVAPATTVTVAGVTDATGAEGNSLVHTVSLSGTTTAAMDFAFALSSGSATGGGVDFASASITFSNGVTRSGANITVPSGVSTFTVTVPTLTDALVEGTETYAITVSDKTATGNITDTTVPNTGVTLMANKTVYPTPTAITTFPYTNPNTNVVYNKLTQGTTNSTIRYGRKTSESRDGTYVLTFNQDTPKLDIRTKSDGAVLRSITGFDELTGDVWWSYKSGEDKVLRYLKGMQFIQMDASTGTETIIRDFTADFSTALAGRTAYLSCDGKGDSSHDSRYWAFSVIVMPPTGTYYPIAFFVYDMQTNTIVSSMTSASNGVVKGDTWTNAATDAMTRPNFVEVSPDGTKVVVAWKRTYSGSDGNLIGTHQDGVHCYPLATFAAANAIKLAQVATKTCWAQHADGRWMFVHHNDRTNYIEASDTTAGWNATGASPMLRMMPSAEFGGYSAVNFGKSYKQGYVLALVNTNEATNPQTGTVYGHNQLLLIPLANATTAYRIGGSRNIYNGAANESQVSGSYSGDHVYWTTNNMDTANKRMVLYTGNFGV